MQRESSPRWRSMNICRFHFIPHKPATYRTFWVEQASQLKMLIRPLHSRDKSSPLCHLLATCTEAPAGLSCSCDLSPDPTTVSVRTPVGYWPGSPERLPGAGELGVGIEARRRLDPDGHMAGSPDGSGIPRPWRQDKCPRKSEKQECHALGSENTGKCLRS